MKKLLFIIYSILFLTYSNAQENVFILVDVSGSANNIKITNEAKNIVAQLCLGQLNMNNFPDWEPFMINDVKIQNIITGQNGPLINKNSCIYIMPFGKKNRYKNHKELKINQFPSDFQNFYYSEYPININDNYTYIQIALAYTSELAKKNNLSNYYIFIVTDNLGDQDDTGSQNIYDQNEIRLILAWDNLSSSLVQSIGSFKTKDYYIHLKKVHLTGKSPVSTPPQKREVPQIKILSYPNGKKGEEKKIESNNITIRWVCRNCPQGTNYRVNITSIEGYHEIDKKTTTKSTSYSTNLEDGKYEVFVSAKDCKSDRTYIEVRTGSKGGMLLFLLILALLVGVGYWYWKKRQSKKFKRLSAERPTASIDENSENFNISEGF